MIPYLFKKDATSFNSGYVQNDTNRIGRLDEAISCAVYEEINGEYMLTLEYPIDGRFVDDLTPYAIITAYPNRYNATYYPSIGQDYNGIDAFRIHHISTPNNGYMTVQARHISFDLSGCVFRNISRTSESAWMTALSDSQYVFGGYNLPWTFTLNAAQLDAGEYEAPNEAFSNTVYQSVNSLIRGDDGLLLTYGGEWEFNKTICRLNAHRGEDRGFTILAGRNLISAVREIDTSNVAIGLTPYAIFNETLVFLPPSPPATMPDVSNRTIIFGSQAYGYGQYLAQDMTSEIQSRLTETEIAALTSTTARQAAIYRVAKQWLKEQEHSIRILATPDVEINSEFIMLSDTSEYSHLFNCEDVRLGDTVTIKYPGLESGYKVEIMSMTYDVLDNKITDVGLGVPRKNYVYKTSNMINMIRRDMKRILKTL